MPKAAYRVFLGVFMLSFVVASCGDKKTKEKEIQTDTIKKKPTDPGTGLNEPTDPGTMPTTPDTIKKKPTDPGT